MDSLYPGLAKLNADQRFKDQKLRGFTNDNLQKLLKSIKVTFPTRGTVESLKTLVAENRTYVVPETDKNLETIIGLWCLRNNRWKTQLDAEGFYVTKPRLKSANQIEDPHSSSEAESSSVEASKEKITQSVHAGYVLDFDDERDDDTIEQEKKEHFKHRQEYKKKQCPQNYSMVMDSPYCSSGETTDDGAANAKTTDKTLKMEPGETSSTPRVIKAATNAKRSEPSGSMFSAFGGIFGALKSKEGPSQPKNPKVRELPAWMHDSGPTPKNTSTPQKTAVTNVVPWQDLLVPELRKICVCFGLQPGNATKTDLIGMIEKNLKHGPEYGLSKESGCHDPKYKRPGFKGKPLRLSAYLECCTKGGRDSNFAFKYDEVIVKQEKSEPCEAIAKKAKIDHPSCIATFPGESRLRRESRMMQKMTEEPISQQHSDAEPESQEMSQEQLESQEQPESQIQEPIEAGASQASQSLHFQHHNPDASLNLYNIGASTMQSLDQTQRPAYDST